MTSTGITLISCSPWRRKRRRKKKTIAVTTRAILNHENTHQRPLPAQAVQITLHQHQKCPKNPKSQNTNFSSLTIFYDLCTEKARSAISRGLGYYSSWT